MHQRGLAVGTLWLVGVWAAVSACTPGPAAVPGTASTPTAGSPVAVPTATVRASPVATLTVATASPGPTASAPSSAAASLPPASPAGGSFDPECETYVTAAVVESTIGRTVNSVRRSAQGNVGDLPDNLECAYDLRSDAGTNIQMYLDTLHEFIGLSGKVFAMLKIESMGTPHGVSGLGLQAEWVQQGPEYWLAWVVQNDGPKGKATTYYLRGPDIDALMKVAPLVVVHRA